MLEKLNKTISTSRVANSRNKRISFETHHSFSSYKTVHFHILRSYFTLIVRCITMKNNQVSRCPGCSGELWGISLLPIWAVAEENWVRMKPKEVIYIRWGRGRGRYKRVKMIPHHCLEGGKSDTPILAIFAKCLHAPNEDVHAGASDWKDWLRNVH